MRYLQEKNVLFNFIMSQNRSVAAAQRRRAAPQQEYNAPPRSPATSIASATNFQQQQHQHQQQQQQQYQQQMTGKMAGQYAAVQQKQYLNPPPQEMNHNTAKELIQTNGVAKMTIPQAITLITLRLGRIENKLQDMEFQNLGQNGSTTSSADIMSDGVEHTTDNASLYEFNERLKKLEELFVDFPQMKQQLEVYKPGIVSIKNISTSNSKEIVGLKTQLIALQAETKSIQSRMTELQTFGISIGGEGDEEFVEEDVISSTITEKAEVAIAIAIPEHVSVLENHHFDADNIKELVKNELKLDISEKTPPTFSGLNG